MVKANASLALECSESFSVTFTYCDNFYNRPKQRQTRISSSGKVFSIEIRNKLLANGILTKIVVD